MHPSWAPRVLGSDHRHHNPGWPSPKEILSQFESLPPTSTHATLQGATPPRRQVPDKTKLEIILDLPFGFPINNIISPDKTHAHMHPKRSPRVLGSDHWHHTPGCPPAKENHSQFESLPPTATPATLQGTTPSRREVPDKTHVHMHPSRPPRVLGSDHWHHNPGWPSAKGILSQFESLPPTATPATLQGTTPPRRQVPDKTHAHMHPGWAPRVLGSDHGIIPQAGPLLKESSPNSNPSHLQPLPPPYTGPLLTGDRYQTRPMPTCTRAETLDF